MKRIGIICGGSGSSKFATSFSEYSNENAGLELGFVTNVADNYWYRGLYVCPDVDIITHALAGNLDTSKGWGVASDTFTAKEALSDLSGSTEWFSLGDSDTAMCQRRTELMKEGWSLSAVTKYFCRTLQIKHAIIPATDDSVMTFIRTAAGLMHLQQYWVKYKAHPEILGISYAGLENAKPNSYAIDFLSDYVLICPANPVTSILPTLRMKQMEKMLKKSRVVAISPFVHDKPFSGPAGKMMMAIGVEPNSYGVAKLYCSILKLFVLDRNDNAQVATRIKDLGIECVTINTRVDDNSKHSIAREIMSLI